MKTAKKIQSRVVGILDAPCNLLIFSLMDGDGIWVVDAGKKCISGNECLAKICIIRGLLFDQSQRQREERKEYIGECPIGTYSSLNEPYHLFCGEAAIENGKVVDDRRSCVY